MIQCDQCDYDDDDDDDIGQVPYGPVLSCPVQSVCSSPRDAFWIQIVNNILLCGLITPTYSVATV